ncbi:MAG: hypothetical protein AB1425_11330, partial [Actinomycetota bacterium]
MQRMPFSSSSTPYWVISRSGGGPPEPLLIPGARGEPVLPVFSDEATAREFLRSVHPGGGWWLRPTGVGELLSLLSGACSGVRSVALDAAPEMAAEGTLGLVSMGRERFLDHLLGRGRSWFDEVYARGRRRGGLTALTPLRGQAPGYEGAARGEQRAA